MPQTPTPSAMAAALADFLNNATPDQKAEFANAMCVEASACCGHGALLLTLALADALMQSAEGAVIVAGGDIEEASGRLRRAPRASVDDHRPDGDDEREDARNALHVARSSFRLAESAANVAGNVARRIRNEVPE